MDDHRRGPWQIRALEAAFKECSHPDATQLVDLSREIGMMPQQIKYWFQNWQAQIKPPGSPTQGSSSSDP